ncbi:MAG: hypothetical protein J5588_05015 [Bacteroidales bacterium]|nr:hypothetical protein [Bacteroidales bacterium]
MKILALEYGHTVSSLDESMACYPDSTLIRNNDDFYIPNFSKQIVAYVGMYLQFNKIGKCIEPRFAQRYFSECGCAIKFFAADVIERNKCNGTATDIARCFDSSLAISNDKITFENRQLDFVAKLNGKPLDCDVDVLSRIHESIATATKYFMVKIGDLFFVPLVQVPVSVTIGDVFDVSLQGKQLLTCTVR